MKKTYKIFVDTDSDFDSEFAKKHDLGLISMPYEINGESVYPYESFDKFEYMDFYKLLDSGKLGTTFSINVDKYIEYFESYLKNGLDILYLHFSKKMSSTFEQLGKAIDILKNKYPERKIMTIDTMSIAHGSFAMCFEAVRLYENDATMDQVASFIENEKYHFASYYFVDNLKHFARSGRVSNTKAFIGNIIGIRPIINMCTDGTMQIVGKVKGKNTAIDKLIEYVDKIGDNVSKYIISIVYTQDFDSALSLKDKIIKRFGGNVNLEMHPLNPTAACHAGPTVTGIAFHSKQR